MIRLVSIAFGVWRPAFFSEFAYNKSLEGRCLQRPGR
jgi:hypothetical protein